MSMPLRKDQPEEDENITTADLAQGKRPTGSPDRPKPVLAGRPGENTQTIPSPERDSISDSSPARDVAQVNISHQARETVNANTAPLFPNNELEDLRHRWSDVQTAFVDEPRKAVEQADSLVASAMKRLAEVFAEERSKLEQQWDRGDNVSTEDLRVALQRYRSFFQRLLSV